MQIDERILSLFKAGEIELFYKRIYPGLITYAARILGEEFSFLAEDCVQDAIYKSYQQKSLFHSPTHFKAFLYACIHNGAVTVIRKNRAKENYVSKQDFGENHLTNSIIEQETLDLLYYAIDNLPEKIRAIFDLSFEQGLKNKDIAEYLNISEITVRKRKEKLIELLRNQLGTSLNTIILLELVSSVMHLND